MVFRMLKPQNIVGYYRMSAHGSPLPIFHPVHSEAIAFPASLGLEAAFQVGPMAERKKMGWSENWLVMALNHGIMAKS